MHCAESNKFEKISLKLALPNKIIWKYQNHYMIILSAKVSFARYFSIGDKNLIENITTNMAFKNLSPLVKYLAMATLDLKILIDVKFWKVKSNGVM